MAIKDHQIIDFHTHIGDVTGKAKDVSPSVNGIMPSNTVEKANYHPLLLNIINNKFFPDILFRSTIAKSAKYSHPENLRLEMERSSAIKSLLLPVEPMVTTEEVLSIAQKNEDLIPLCSVDLEHIDAERIETEIKRKLKLFNFTGIKYHPNIQNTHPASLKAQVLYRTAGENNLFILVHGGKTPFLKNENRAYGCLRNFDQVLTDHRNVKFVFAHMGKYFDPSAEVFDILKKHRNVWVDTSGISSHTIFEGLCKLGPQKIMFGSDWPYGGQIKSLALLERAVVKYCNSFGKRKDDVLSRILRKNACSMLQAS